MATRNKTEAKQSASSKVSFSDLLEPVARRLDTMDAAAVKAWLGDVLAERVSLPRALPDDSPVPALVALDPLLDDIHRDHLRRAMREAVSTALANDPEGNGLRWLLLVLARVEDRMIGSMLARYAATKPFAELPANTKCRVLATIRELHFIPGNPKFWERLLEDRDAKSFSGLAFVAIAENDLEWAFQLLPRLPADERTLHRIALAHLPFLWSTATQDTKEKILRSLGEIRRTCPPELGKALDDFADVVGLNLTWGNNGKLFEGVDKVFSKLRYPYSYRPIAVGILQ